MGRIASANQCKTLLSLLPPPPPGLTVKCLSCGKEAEETLCSGCVNDLLAEPILAASPLVGSTVGRLMEGNSMALFIGEGPDTSVRAEDKSFFAMIEAAKVATMKKKDCTRLLGQIRLLLLHSGVPWNVDLEKELLVREGDIRLMTIALDRLEGVEERFEALGDYSLYLLAGNLFSLVYIKRNSNVLSILPDEFGEAYLGEAEYYYKKALAKDSERGNTWRNRGWLLISAGKVGEAEECFKKALIIENRDEQAWFGTAYVHYSQELYEEGIKAADKVIEMLFNSWEAWDLKGKCLEKMGRSEEALSCYDRALDIAPDKEETWLNKGNLLMLMEREEESVECYEAALRLNPKARLQDENLWFDKGHLLFAQARYDEAASAFKRVVDIKKGNKAGWFWLGRSLLEKTAYAQAADAFKRAIEIEPWIEARMFLGKALHLMEDHRGAIKVF
ncbi:MAG: tetratricopeptide repeat protein, partial [Thermoplasmata archaeon]|nr:tetratricopeptide repeat protein [Thermoplasmata archaeon]